MWTAPPVTQASTPLVLKPAANQTTASTAPWRTPPKAPPPKAKARPTTTETSRPSSRTITARPVPEFTEDSPNEAEEPQEDTRAAAVESEIEEKEVHADEDNEEGEEEEGTSEEEMEPDEKQKPQGNAEILSVLNKLTSAVTTLVERDQQKSSRAIRRSRSPSTSSRRSRKARRSRSARRGRSHEKAKSSRKAKESRRPRGSSSSITRRPLPASSSKRARNPSPKKKKPVKEARPDKKATASKSTRARSARPKTPGTVPRSPSHPPPANRLLRRPEYQEHQRSELEDELWDHLNHEGTPSTSQVEPELLFALVDSASSWGNRDRVLWLVNRNLPTDQQQWQGIRVEVKIRANVYNTSIFKAGWMTRNGWIKTVYARSRTEGAPWQRIQVGAWTSDNVDLQDPWSDTVCFTHRAPRGYMALQQSLVETPKPRVRSFVPPTPPKPKRIRDLLAANAVEIKESPDVPKPICSEPEPKTPSSPASSVPEDYEPVAHMAWIISGASSSEIVLDENETDSDVQQHDPGVSLQVGPNERTTMSRKHRKAVLEGIDRLNHQDALVKSSFGLKDLSFAEPTTLVITSHPRLFQELQTHDHVADVFDVGVGAENVNQDEDPKVWYDILQDYKNIIIAIEYGQDSDALKHGKILGEVESHCDVSGCRFLHIDVASTERWEEHMFPQIPHINDHGLAFTCNDPKWTELFESWFRGCTMDDVLSWQFVDWMSEWINDTTL